MFSNYLILLTTKLKMNKNIYYFDSLLPCDLIHVANNNMI